MSVSGEVLQQIDDLLSMSVDGIYSNIASPNIPKEAVSQHHEHYEEYDGDTTLVNSYDQSEMSSIETVETSVTSMEIGFQEKIHLYTKCDNTILYRKLKGKHENLNNILDCMDDMIQQETKLIEEQLQNFITEVTRSVPYNSFDIRLDLPL